ncbi:MAG: heat-inducible transcription repressor HrcA [Lachnospiraceae bacterium]|nr:heat-inducible transcription repressor HrcA [Lachnospiraceae bacterium]
MELDERKMKILRAIIRTYLDTGEPVGSRTISKDAELNVSSATIRNEMSDLEELGLIVQPHTSAGRIPTDAGYRLYVDELMEEKERAVMDVRDVLGHRMDRIENTLQTMAKFLARNTNYATMISGPRYTENELRLVQLSRLDSRHLVTVIVMEGNLVRNKVIEIESPVSDNEILKLNVLLNSALQGKTLDNITLTLIRRLKEQAGDYSGVVGSVLEAVADAISESSEEQPDVYTSGATNIFKYPELSDGSKASGILTTFEDKDQLLNLMSLPDKTDGSIQVYIGKETPIQSMQDCSIVTANYELDKGIRGTIGIVGPKRMDYEHVVGTLKTLMEQLDDIYHKKEEEA